MTLKQRRSLTRTVGAVGLAVTLLLAACGNSDDDEPAAGGTDTTETSGAPVELDVPGVTNDEIRFSAFGTNSNNPLGTCVLDCYVDGIEAYFAWRNSEGGIHGRDLVLSKILDDELGKNQQRALEIVSADDTFASFSATQIASGWQEMVKAGIPLYTWSIHKEGAQPSIYGYMGAFCDSCTARAPALIAKLAGAKKIATLGYGISENSKRSAEYTAKSIEMYSSNIGGTKPVYVNTDLPFGLPNGVGPEVTAMKRAGVDMVFGSLDLNAMKTFAQEMERQGMGDVPMYHLNTYNQSFVKAAGDLFEGDYMGVAFRPFEADAGGSDAAEFRKWMKKTGSEITELAMFGWINADEAYRGLEAAGPEFDRAKVIEASNTKLTSYTAGGLIPPLDWSRQHEPPTQDDPTSHGAKFECIALVRVEDGAFTVVGDKSKPWSCWSNENREWSEPVRMNFE